MLEDEIFHPPQNLTSVGIDQEEARYKKEHGCWSECPSQKGKRGSFFLSKVGKDFINDLGIDR